jgi:nucleoid-associated protein YejK
VAAQPESSETMHALAMADVNFMGVLKKWKIGDVVLVIFCLYQAGLINYLAASFSRSNDDQRVDANKVQLIGTENRASSQFQSCFCHYLFARA